MFAKGFSYGCIICLHERIFCSLFKYVCRLRFRLDEAVDEIERMNDEDELRSTPFLILANKQDLPDALSPE